MLTDAAPAVGSARGARQWLPTLRADGFPIVPFLRAPLHAACTKRDGG
jgi:hypothetical protein